jgi:spore maturation protein CgeB
MRVVLFVHSLLSDWNHGNAHFLRGVATELLARGHDVRVYEPIGGWSLTHLLEERGEAALLGFRAAYPLLSSLRYDPTNAVDPDLDEALDGADLVLVHEWNDPDLVRRLGEHRRQHHGYRLLFHDTHHRAVTAPEAMAAMAANLLGDYDGVLAFGAILRDLYLARGWAARAWTWHEAADTRVFHPILGEPPAGDLVWIGNWGDEERTAELAEFLLEPVEELALRARVHGVRYPEPAKKALAAAGIEYAGWLPNYEVPKVFARFAVTLHVPRRPYAEALPGIPTIRPFEALACGIPLVSAPWEDSEGLFTPGRDYLVARNGAEMKRHLTDLLHDRDRATELARHGRRTVLDRHTCSHRVDELLAISEEIAPVREEVAENALL